MKKKCWGKISVQTGCRARGREGHEREEQAWRHSSSLQGGPANAKHMAVVLAGWKRLCKGPDVDSRLGTRRNSPWWLRGQLAPQWDRVAAGALKPPTAPLRHRKLSNRLTKGLLITIEPGGGKLIPRINRIIVQCLFPVLCLSCCPEFIPLWCCIKPIARNVNAVD